VSVRKRTPIVYNGRVVGVVEGGVYRRRIHGSRHLLRKPPAIGVSLEVLAQLQALGVERLEVEDVETGTTYWTPLAHFVERSFAFNYGFGEQAALPLSGWIVERRGQQNIQLPLMPAAKPALFKTADGRQLNMFSGEGQ
jgi:hypothetical protein